MEKIKKKVIVVGNPGVGKTALVKMYCSNGQEFPKEYHMTQVSDIASKIIELEDDQDVELFFFDVSGRELYRTAVNKLIQNPDFSIMVYDSTSSESFKGLKEWVGLVKQAGGDLSAGILISTKNDLSTMREVKPKQGKDLAEKMRMPFFEVDATNYQMVEQAFSTIAPKLL